MTGKRAPKSQSTFEKFANGLDLPPAAWRAMGLTAGSPAAPVSPGPPTDAGLAYPDTATDATRNVSLLWRADLADITALQRGRADPHAWTDASLRWLVDPGHMPDDQPERGVGIAMSDVERFRATVDMFAQLDDRFGGGHARQALIQYLSTDAQRMLNGRYSDTVGRALFGAVAIAARPRYAGYQTKTDREIPIIRLATSPQPAA